MKLNRLKTVLLISSIGFGALQLSACAPSYESSYVSETTWVNHPHHWRRPDSHHHDWHPDHHDHHGSNHHHGGHDDHHGGGHDHHGGSSSTSWKPTHPA